MARLTKTDAARQLGIARVTLYKLIAQGKVSATADGLIDQAELVRVAPYIDRLHERTRTPADAHERTRTAVHERTQTSTDTTGIAPQTPGETTTAREPEAVHERTRTAVHERTQSSTDTLVDLLRDQLRLMQEREQTLLRLTEEREQAYRDHIARLTEMLDQAHQQNQRLLDMPRSPALPPHSPQEAPGATQPVAPRHQTPVAPQAPPGDARGAMRRRIVALLRERREGLTPAEIRDLLGVERSLTDTLLGMLRDGLVQRVGRGRYVAAEHEIKRLRTD